MTILDISHDPQAQRFSAEVEGGTATCVYRLQGSRMDIVHTEVPWAVEGRGFAGQMVQAALDHARAQGWRVRPLCSYVAAYMRRHPETLDLLDR